MRIAITGASGFIGEQLVPLLAAEGAELLLIGRNPAQLRVQFPRHAVTSYEEIASAASGFDLLLHLATRNSDSNASYEEFARDNIELTANTCNSARLAGVKRFVFCSSTHALDDQNQTSYARSKREAACRIEGETGINVCVLYLPAVIGAQFSGRLGMLNGMPAYFQRTAVSLLTALKPTARIELVCETILQLAAGSFIDEPVVLISTPQNAVFRVLKRAMDLAFAISIIALFWWAMIVIWAIVRIQSPGAGIFRQERVGKHEKTFHCYKFRTMYISTPNAGTHEVSTAAVTPTGAFLRRTKLDELPQVFNILMNQMSLVGPRPCLPSQKELRSERRRHGVFDVIPGITGLAQINGIDMSEPAILAQCDARYIALQSVLLDLRIILATAIGRGQGDRIR